MVIVSVGVVSGGEVSAGEVSGGVVSGGVVWVVPFECGKILRAQREEKLDQNEQDDEHLKNAEKAYLEIAKLYNFNKIECGNKNKIKNIEEIHNDLIKVIEDFL